MYEYMTFEANGNRLAKKLNEHAKQGWQMVSCHPAYRAMQITRPLLVVMERLVQAPVTVTVNHGYGHQAGSATAGAYGHLVDGDQGQVQR